MRRLSKTSANLEDARLSGWRTIRKVAPYLWPEGEPEMRGASCFRW